MEGKYVRYYWLYHNEQLHQGFPNLFCSTPAWSISEAPNALSGIIYCRKYTNHELHVLLSMSDNAKHTIAVK